MISPPILLLAIPAMVFAALGVTGRRFRPRDEVGLVGLAWFIGTYAPFVLTQPVREPDELPLLHGDRDAGDLRRGRRPDRTDRADEAACCIAWMVSVLAAVVVMYPFTPLP